MDPQVIRQHTERVHPFLVPELILHLVTHRCPLWRADETELKRLGFEEPFWAFAWAGGQALARFLLDRPERVRGCRVLDVGSGSGLVGLAAARAGAAQVTCSDVDPIAVQAIRLNGCVNGLSHLVTATVRDYVGQPQLPFDVVTLGDVTYDSDLGRHIGVWAHDLAAEGMEVYVGDPDRGFLDLTGFETVAVLQASSDVDDQGTHTVPTRILRLAPKT